MDTLLKLLGICKHNWVLTSNYEQAGHPNYGGMDDEYYYYCIKCGANKEK